MRPLIELRWIILAILLWLWPVEQPSEQELIAYGAEQERREPDPLKSPFYIEQIRTQEIQAINAETARELQRHLDAKHSEPPQQNTGPIHLHAIRLQHIHTEEMPIAFPMRDTDKWLVR